MATKKAAAKKASKKKSTSADKPQQLNITGVIVPDDCQTCTSVFMMSVSLTPGKPKRVKIVGTGSPINKLKITG